MNKLQNWLESLKLEEPQIAYELFAVFPLTVAETNGRDYLTLQEAIEQGLVVIAETGNVSEIVVKVAGEKPILIVEGEIVVGGLQNRKVAISLLLEAGKEHRIPVSCVERGRWRPSRTRFLGEPQKFLEKFDVETLLSHSMLRAVAMLEILESYQRHGRLVVEEAQSSVWTEVSRKLRASRSHSPTEDETAFFKHHKVSVDELLQPLKPVSNQVGVIVAIGEKFVGAELFDHPETWRILHRKILSSYAADALEAIWSGVKGVMQNDEVVGFWKSVISELGKSEVKRAPAGLGEHILLNGNLEGFALTHNGSIRHLFAFRGKPIHW